MSEATAHDVIKEFEFYLKSALPAPAILAWMETLSPEERQQVQDHATKMYEAMMAMITNVKEAFKAVGISFAEYIAAGLEELEDERNDSIT